LIDVDRPAKDGQSIVMMDADAEALLLTHFASQGSSDSSIIGTLQWESKPPAPRKWWSYPDGELVFYTWYRPKPISCEVVAFSKTFPRNVLYCQGFVLRVQTLYVLLTQKRIAYNDTEVFIVPRSIVRICRPGGEDKSTEIPQCLSRLTFESDSNLAVIEGSAFEKCYGLKSIFIPSSVAWLCPQCFGSCPSLSCVAFDRDSKLTQIEATFPECRKLEWVSLPSSIRVVGDYCFDNCRMLSWIGFESDSKLDQIGSQAFSGCGRLKSICIPSSVVTLGSSCFHGSGLLSLIFWPGSKLHKIDSYAFFGCSALKSICIPPSVEFLGEECFRDCGSLSSLIFESGSKLKEIGERAFFNCNSLRSIRMPPSDGLTLKEFWYKGSSLQRVIFDSGRSLLALIQAGTVDLWGRFEIFASLRDGVTVFPGYSVTMIP
jgi:hypothetical protein